MFARDDVAPAILFTSPRYEVGGLLFVRRSASVSLSLESVTDKRAVSTPRVVP